MARFLFLLNFKKKSGLDPGNLFQIENERFPSVSQALRPLGWASRCRLEPTKDLEIEKSFVDDISTPGRPGLYDQPLSLCH